MGFARDHFIEKGGTVEVIELVTVEIYEVTVARQDTPSGSPSMVARRKTSAPLPYGLVGAR